MRVPKAVNYAITVVFILIILALLVGQLLGQPMLIFVETGSMEPTLEPGDGFIAIPQQFAGEISEGDVVMFDAQEVGGGGPTTHRVVDVRDDGYVTQGDANPFTDQDGGEPIVAEGQIQSVALQPGGELLVIPQIGVGVEAVSGATAAIVTPIAELFGMDPPDGNLVGLFVLAGGLVLLILSMVTEGGKVVRSRVRRRKGLLENVFVIVAILTLVVIVPLNISMLMPSGVYGFEIVSSNSPSESPGVIEAGESEEVTYMMQNSGHIPVIVFLEPASAGVEIPDGQYVVPRSSSVETEVIMHAPEETGPHLRMVQEHRYLMVLPPSVIASLHHIHPFAAIAVINLFVVLLVTLLTVTTLGTGRDRTRERSRDISWLDNLFR